MSDSEAKFLLNEKIKDCKREKNNELFSPFGTGILSFISIETVGLFVREVLEELGIAPTIHVVAFILSYAMMTVESPLTFKYSKSEYLKFLKGLKEELKKENPFEDININDFDKELSKKYKLTKES